MASGKLLTLSETQLSYPLNTSVVTLGRVNEVLLEPRWCAPWKSRMWTFLVLWRFAEVSKLVSLLTLNAGQFGFSVTSVLDCGPLCLSLGSVSPSFRPFRFGDHGMKVSAVVLLTEALAAPGCLVSCSQRDRVSKPRSATCELLP